MLNAVKLSEMQTQYEFCIAEQIIENQEQASVELTETHFQPEDKIMPLLSFDNLVTKFGEVVAWQCLVEIEKAARILPSSASVIDPEIRLAHALRVQDAITGLSALAAA